MAGPVKTLPSGSVSLIQMPGGYQQGVGKVFQGEVSSGDTPVMSR
jgi:hypothetical protein